MKMVNLVTDAGDLDLTFHPDGTGGYDDLARAAIIMRTADGTQAKIAALADIIRSKEAAGRRKDAEALPELRALAGLPRSPDIAALSFPQPASTPPKQPSPQERIAAARVAAVSKSQANDTAHDHPGADQ